MVIHGAEKALSIPVEIGITLITVFLHACQKPGYRLHKRVIVHHSVPLVSSQPAGGVAVVLCQHDRLWVGLLHRVPEIPPELVVVLAAVA